ncbi:MAG: FABP family protein [Planctomycetes bacterium]|nr:FABP family protein [Planctomycetota bacterium]
MHRIVRTPWLALAALCAATAFAEEPNERLRPLAWLVGNWEGRGKYGDGEFVDSVSYDWTHGKNFIKWTAEARMEGQVVHSETGMLGWDQAKKRLIWFSFGLDGTIGQAEDEASTEKDTWIAHGNVGDQPPWNDTRQILRKVDDDTYTTEVQTKTDGKYVKFFLGTYKRKKAE